MLTGSILFGCFLGMIIALRTGHTEALDGLFCRMALELRSPEMTALMLAVSFFGSPFFLTAAPFAALLFSHARRSGSVGAAASLIFAELLKELLQDIIRRPRPDTAFRLTGETSFSFPSGHATGSTAYYLYLALSCFSDRGKRTGDRNAISALRLTAGILFAALPVLIGLSRVYLFAHYASDVLAGWLFGGSVAFISYGFSQKQKDRHGADEIISGNAAN